VLVVPRGEENQARQLRFLLSRWGIAACALLFFVMTTARRSWNFFDWLFLGVLAGRFRVGEGKSGSI